MFREEDYEDLAIAPLFKALFELEREGAEIDYDNLTRKTEDDESAAAMIPMVLMNSSLHASNEHYIAAECVTTFRLMKVDERIDELRRELVIAEREQDMRTAFETLVRADSVSTQRQSMLPCNSLRVSEFGATTVSSMEEKDRDDVMERLLDWAATRNT